MNDKPVKIAVKLGISNNPHGIPPGTIIDVKITITDEYEMISTSNPKFTKDLAKVAPLGTIAKYSERLQKTIVKYPGKSKEEITKLVQEDLKKVPTIK